MASRSSASCMLVPDFLSQRANDRAAASKGSRPRRAETNEQGMMHTRRHSMAHHAYGKDQLLGTDVNHACMCSWTAVRALRLPSALKIGLPVLGF